MKGYILNMPDEKNLLDKATEIVAPELYQDALQPVAKETGKFLARPLRVINALFCRIDKWIHRKQCSIEDSPSVPQEPSQLQKDIQVITKSIKCDLSFKQKNVYLRFFNKYKKYFSKDDIDSLNKKSSEFSPEYDNLLSELLGLIESLQE